MAGGVAEVQKLGREVKLSVAIERYDVVDTGGPSDGGSVNRGLDVLKARISLVQSGTHVEYTLRVTYEGKTWTVRKRFSEFVALQDVLKKRLPGLPELPGKTAVRQFGTEHVEARKAALSAYLEHIVGRRDVLNCQEVHQFLGLPENVASFRQPHASEPVQAAEVHEAAFGIADFDYDPMQGLLLLGATDCSWTSRMDTKITNIKLPWEPAAPNLPTSQMSLWRQSPADLRFDMQFTCRYTATISCVALATVRDKGICLAGLSDGTVGYHPVRGEPGVNNAGSTLPLLRHTAGVAALAVDDAEGWIISASKDCAVVVYDSRKQTLLCEVQTPSPTTKLHYCQAQKRLFCGLLTGRVVAWDTSMLPFQLLCSIPDCSDLASASKISALDYDAATSTIFTGGKDGFALWAMKISGSTSWGRCVGQLRVGSSAPSAVAWANSSREILAGFGSGAVVVFDVDRGEATYALQAHKDQVTSIMWLDAPRRLLTASKDKTLKIWDFPSLRREPLEDQPAFGDDFREAAALAGESLRDEPTVSLPPHMRPRPGAPGPAAAANSHAEPSGGRGGDPLLGRRAGGASASNGGPLRADTDSGGYAGSGAVASSSCADPLSRSFGDAATGGYAARSAGTEPPLAPGRAAAAPRGPAADPLRGGGASAGYVGGGAAHRGGEDGPLFAGGNAAAGAISRQQQAPPIAVGTATGPARPKVAGAPPSACIAEDSDDDLRGWDS